MIAFEGRGPGRGCGSSGGSDELVDAGSFEEIGDCEQRVRTKVKRHKKRSEEAMTFAAIMDVDKELLFKISLLISISPSIRVRPSLKARPRKLHVMSGAGAPA
jgi:hypothetical protein